MIKAKERFYENLGKKARNITDQLLAITLDRQDYPNFDPDHADQVTLAMIGAGSLAVELPGQIVGGICV